MTKQQVADALDGRLLDFQDTELDSPRGRLIALACRNGWVRVRRNGPSFAFQFAGGAQRVVKAIIKKFLPEMGSGNRILLSDFASGQGREYSPQELTQMAQEDAFSDQGSESPVPEKVRTDAKKPVVRKDGIPAGMPDHVARQRLRNRLMSKIGPTIRQFNDDATRESLWTPKGWNVENPVLLEQTMRYERCKLTFGKDDIQVMYSMQQQARVCEHLYGWEPILKG